MSDAVLGRLAELIRTRRLALSDMSYTRQLLDGGLDKCAKKFGEEAVELVIASLRKDDDAVKSEAADVLYHLLVLFEIRGITIDEVLAVLERRIGTSGLAEKAARTTEGERSAK